MTNTFTLAVAVIGGFTATTLGFARAGRRSRPVSATHKTRSTAPQRQAFNVILNGATVYPLSACKVTGIDGLNSSNIDSSGRRIDPEQFDAVYVDISCRGG